MGPSCVTSGEPAKAVCSVPCGEGIVMLVTTCINSAGLPAPDSLCGGCKLEPTATICAPGPCTRARRADNSGCLLRIGIFRGTAACSQPDGGELLAIPSDPAQPQQSLCIASLLFPTVSGLYERWAKLSGLGAMLSVSVYTDALCTVPATAVSSMSDGAPSEVFTIREGSCNTRDTGECSHPHSDGVRCVAPCCAVCRYMLCGVLPLLYGVATCVTVLQPTTRPTDYPDCNAHSPTLHYLRCMRRSGCPDGLRRSVDRCAAQPLNSAD